MLVKLSCLFCFGQFIVQDYIFYMVMTYFW